MYILRCVKKRTCMVEGCVLKLIFSHLMFLKLRIFFKKKTRRFLMNKLLLPFSIVNTPISISFNEAFTKMLLQLWEVIRCSLKLFSSAFICECLGEGFLHIYRIAFSLGFKMFKKLKLFLISSKIERWSTKHKSI